MAEQIERYVTIQTGTWTRIDDWEVYQETGENVIVRVAGGEVHLPCAGAVRPHARQDPMVEVPGTVAMITDAWGVLIIDGPRMFEVRRLT